MDKKMLETAKELLKFVKDNPKAVEELIKAKPVIKDDKPHPSQSPEAKAHTAKQTGETVSQALKPLGGADKSKMLSHLRSLKNPSQLQSPENLAFSRRQMIKEELKSEWKPKFYKAETKHDRCVRKVKEQSPEIQNPHAACVAVGVKPSKWKKAEKDASKSAKIQIAKKEAREIIKEELKSEWKPKFYKKACKTESMPSSAGPAMTTGDQNATAMKAQKDPSAKPVFSGKRIKPSDVKDIGPAGMVIPKPTPPKGSAPMAMVATKGIRREEAKGRA
jgi:hypothetical protein